MFVSQNHHCHDESWLFHSEGEINVSHQCLACLIDTLSDISVSRVQREVAISMVNSMIQCSNGVQDALMQNVDKCLSICNLMFDFYTKEPFKKTSVPLCVNLIYKLPKESGFQMLTERVTSIIFGNPSGENLHFYMEVIHHLSEKALDFVKLLCFNHGDILEDIVRNKNHFDLATTITLAHILKYAVRVLLEAVPVDDQVQNSLVLEVSNTLNVWLESSTSHDLQIACLELLSECVKSPTLITDLLLRGEREGSLLLLGLKRLLAFKQDTLIVMGTQCLTKLVENISEPLQIKMILDTDLAEFIFEFLHTSNFQQLCCVFKCLHAMAQHQLFFDKCHAVYGLESTLSAIQMAIDTKRNTVLEKGLLFLTCLLDRQPENMPLFLNQSWWTCAGLLQDSLRSEYQDLVPTTLFAIEAFFRLKHQQNRVDVKVIGLIVKAVMSASKIHFQMLCQEQEENITLSIFKCLFAIVTSLNKLMLSENILCGNESSSLNALQQTVKSLCINSLLPITIDNWHHLNDEDLVLGFFTFLDIAIKMTDTDEELMQVVPMKLLHQGLLLLSQPFVSTSVQCKGLDTLIFTHMKYAERVKPSLYINSEEVLSGFIGLQWSHASSLDCFIEKMINSMDRGAMLSLVYLSLLHGYSIADAKTLLQFLKAVVHVCPHILSGEAYIVRSFVYILAVCQTNIQESADSLVFEGSGIDYISGLQHLPVETWYTSGPAVFSWALLTEEKMETLASPMVEYWLVHLNHSSSQFTINLEDLTDQDKAIITSMVPDKHFLQCLMQFLHLNHIGAKARSVLIYCIAQLSDYRTSEMALFLLKSLLSFGTQKLEILFVQSTDPDFGLANNLLHVLCALLKSTSSAKDLGASCFKSVYNVVKIISKCWDQEVTLAPAVEYFAEMLSKVTFQESQTIIPVVLQSEKCISFLETTFENSSNKMFRHGLTVIVWLAANGQFYEAKNFVTVKSEFLLTYLTTCGRPCFLLILQLLKHALTAMTERRTMFGACHFFKGHQAFIPSKIFSNTELRQVYGYLQQYVSQEDSALRFEAMESIKTLIKVGAELGQFIMHHPWNKAMLETLSSRVENGLQDYELTFYTLYSTQNPVLMWSSASANNFLLALLNSSLTTQQQEMAFGLVKKIKNSQVTVDTSLLEMVEICIQDCEEW